ncbi:short-chain dehydrogenase/reductase SDR [Actinosynnema mirum DSM 43827]|uniref:Short-chain dehydrogenase/reductase SDR n=1 Tax=Actinosynnema mirum (strain ATCC 29888 / DSM 43827 / JCM 3225 / NBRC 14064 / NCIMB 13271 / NRRL B-12336 / IMRU 3971 / 101) TaxID=446462 RepID=C6WCS5_ACTMD|nr:short-chain dehydrogenase/reductase SDR [Actinosynnema mirum DSM 43827]
MFLRVVVLPFGAAMGMGYETAKLFAEAGAKVVEAGGEARFVEVDVSSSEQVQGMVAATVAAYGRLDVAVCMKYEIRRLLEQGGGGSIVNISSVSGFRPQPNNIAYVAAKHGVVGMTKVAALAETGQTAEEFAPQLSLLGRFGQGREIAQAGLWLASDASSYLTGTTIHADAGYTAR